MVNVVSAARLQPQLKVRQHFNESLTINQLDRWRSVPVSLSPGILCERRSCEDDPFVGSTHHRASEVTHHGWAHGGLESLALKENSEAHEWVNHQEAVAIDAPIPASARDDHLFEASFSEQSLTKPLKASRGQSLEEVKGLVTVVGVDRVGGN
jgi:hypothetical protein